MKKKISWFKNKKNIFAFLIFFTIFILSLDFWQWTDNHPFFLGLPLWIYYLIIITLLTSVYYFFITKNIWSDKK